MPAPDYPRVPFPASPASSERVETRWWYERPYPWWVVEGIDGLSPSVRKSVQWADKLPVAKLAEAIEKGLVHDGWPWELTRKGKALFGGSRRR